MFSKLKMKFAARRVKTKKKTRRATKNKKTFWTRIWNIICWPFRAIAKITRRIWNWVCKINLIGLLNLTLLAAIIVLFSVLIMNVIGCRKQSVVIVAKPTTTQQVVVTDAPAPRKITERTVKLPMHIDPQTNKRVTPAVNVVPVKRASVEIAKRQTATKNNKFWGDVIVDSRAAGAMIQNGAQVNGNLYLQNMRKYTLPCDIRINGNLFLRDVNMLQFCGNFVITGNIYVSPRSSFGPIPKTARLGGHVIL